MEKLEKLRSLFVNQKILPKGELALDKNNNPINIHNPNAVAFCLNGGMVHVGMVPSYVFLDTMDNYISPQEESSFIYNQFEGIRFPQKESKLINWNNRPETTLADVVSLIDKAIEARNKYHAGKNSLQM